MKQTDKEQYEQELVHYCENCLSLNIRELPGINIDICNTCGNSDIKQIYMEEWNALYIKRYGKPFMMINEDRFN